MKKQKNLYEILGVEKSASASEIKTAFRKLARKYHPDMHSKKSTEEQKQMQERFKEINHAYDVLSDEQKKKIYDLTGNDGSDGMGANFSQNKSFYGHGDGGSFFKEFAYHMGGFGFGDHADAEDFYGSSKGKKAHNSFFSQGGRSGHQPMKNEVVEYKLNMTLEEICTGATKVLTITKKLRTHQIEKKTIEVNILPGYKPGTKITFENAGDEYADGRGTDLIIVLTATRHPLYSIDKCDVIHSFIVSLKTILKGEPIKTIKGLTGEPIIITRDVLDKDLTSGVIAGKGLPDRTKGGKRGNLVLKPQLIIDLSEDELQRVRQALYI
ncbi:hypothetical protein NEFER03_0517 [Nematocida sp. LUAm3]|nr:hypothetical protein NEFER03_0517 [Nematocida sp. LUAm3]KAI5175484.1 hypothetical protein NEFER02_1390 [Nematocida sp. LUAm2]KAI5178486.1 hypothetical protein NEFER01_1633 [Nematocida sp. LUAm1]